MIPVERTGAATNAINKGIKRASLRGTAFVVARDGDYFKDERRPMRPARYIGQPKDAVGKRCLGQQQVS
jgi:hypothetical protein